MMDTATEKISSRQLIILIVFYTVGSSILLLPGILAQAANQDAWIASLIGTCISMSILWLFYALANRFPRMTIAQYSEYVLGKWLGKVISAFLFCFYIILSAFLLREIGDFLTTQILLETPMEATLILFMSVVVVAARLGIETLAKASELILPFAVLLFIVIVGFLAPQMKLDNLLPVMEAGAKPLVGGVIPFITDPFLELSVFLMILPHINKTSRMKKALFQGVLIGASCLMAVVALSVLVLGAKLTANQIYPSFVLAKRINIGDFIQRMEAIVAGLWFVTIFFKLSIVFYAMTVMLRQSCRLKESRFLAFPLAVVLVPLSLVISPNRVFTEHFVSYTWSLFAFTTAFAIPLLLLVVAWLRKRRQPHNIVTGG